MVSICGGAGTLSELAFAWQLRKPVIAFSTAGGWSQELSGRRLDNSRKDEIKTAKNVKEVISQIKSVMRI